MHLNELFVHTINEIGQVIEAPTNYRILRSSALLRQLLVDGNRLVDVVNRDLKLQISYTVSDIWETPYAKLVLEDGPTFYATLDGLREALNKSIVDFSVPVIGKAWFSDDSQNQWLIAADFGSASLRCGNR